MYADTPDHELLALCRQGREAAWSTLVRRHQRLVYAIPRQAGLGDRMAAEVFQVTFARLFDNLGRLDDATRVRAWLVSTAQRETLRALEPPQRNAGPAGTAPLETGNGPTEPGAGGAGLPDTLPEARLDELQRQDRVRHALERLDPRSRQLLQWLYLDENPPGPADIAARLGIDEGSVGPLRARCLDQLRAVLASM